MPISKTFDDYVDDFQREGLARSRGEAIAMLRQHYEAGNPKVRAIPNIDARLEAEGAKGELAGMASGFVDPFTQSLAYAGRLGRGFGVPGAQYLEKPEQMRESIQERYEPSIGGEIAGEVGGFAAGGAGMSRALGPVLRGAAEIGVPGAEWLGGATRGARMARGGAGMGAAAGVGAFGPKARVLPAAAMGAAGPAVEDALGAIFGKMLEEKPARIMTQPSMGEVQAEQAPFGPVAGEVIGQPNPLGGVNPPIGQPRPLAEVAAPQPGPFDPYAATPGVGAGTGSSFQRPPAPLVGQPNPLPPGPFGTPTELGAPPPEPITAPTGFQASGTPVGLSRSETGKPLDITSHMVQVPASRPGMFRYVGKEHPLGAAGKVEPAHFNKVYQLPVAFGGEAGYRDAARMLYSNNDAALRALDNTKDPVGLSEELIGRWAKGAGYDGVVFETPDLDDNFLLDVRSFKSTNHPDITKEVTAFRRTPKASPLSEDLPKGDPATEAVAQRVSEEMAEDPSYLASGAVPPGGVPPPDDVVAQAVLGNLDAQHEEIQNAARYMKDRSISWFAYMRPPAAAVEGPEHAQYMQDIFEKFAHYDKRETNRLGRMYRRIRGPGFKPEEFDEIARAMWGMDYNDLGKLEQGDPSISDPRINGIAKKLFSIKDRLYTIRTGNAPQVPHILEKWAIPHNDLNIRRLKRLQSPGGEIALMGSGRPATQMELAAARETEGMLNFMPWHNLDMQHIQGFLNFDPIANERTRLEQAIRESLAQKADGVLGPDGLTEMASYKEALDRIKHLDETVQRDAMRSLPSRDYIPKRAFYGPTALAAHPEARAIFFEKDPDVVFDKWIRGNLRAAKSDYMLWRTRSLLAANEAMPASTKEFYTHLANVVRGATGYRGDAKFARWWNRGPLGKMKEIDAGEVHDITNYILGWQTWTKLLISPFRFPVINLSHPLVTLYPVVGEKYFAKGLARVMARPVKAFEEAIAAGDIGHESQWFEEIGKQSGQLGFVQRLLRTPTYWTENFRIVLAREAALAQAADGVYSPLVRGFNRDTPGFNQVQRARAYARALVSTTQFRFGPEGKPLAFTGSPIRRLVSQFRTWPAGIGSLYADMIKRGDVKGLMRGFSAMFIMGGLPALAGGAGAFKLLQHELMKHGHYLPDQTGFQMGIEAAGLGGTGLESADILSLREPFELVPYSLPGVFGPALGSTIDTTMTTWNGLHEDNYRKVVSQLISYAAGPQAVAMGQAASQLWQHGQVFGPSGELEATRPLLASIMRGVDVGGSTRSMVWEYTQKMADAVESGNATLIERIASEARERGVVLGPQFEARVRAILSRRGKEASPW